MSKIILTTGDITNKEYEILGLAVGNAVQAKNIFKDIGAGLKSMVGGKLGSYKKLLAETRKIVFEELKHNADKMGADAVIWIRQSTSSIMPGASEIAVIGTAIKFK